MKIGEYYWLGIAIITLGFWKITDDIAFQMIGALAITCTGLLLFSRLWKEHKNKG